MGLRDVPVLVVSKCCPCFRPCLSWSLLATVMWFLSSKARNRLQHALNGNPGHPRVPMGMVLPKELRAAGWYVSPAVETPCQVFDVRLRKDTVEKALAVCGVGSLEGLQIVGGDFLTVEAQKDIGGKLIEDGMALKTDAEAWGKMIFVNPRPHLARWVQEVLRQMKLLGVQKVVIAVVVKRGRLQVGRDICMTLPALHPLFHTEGLTAKVRGLSMRAGVRRIPAEGSKLPPERWEDGFLSAEDALVVVDVEATAGESRPEFQWDAEAPPKVEVGLEELVVEVVLAAGTRPAMGGQLLQAGVRKLARDVGLQAPAFVKSLSCFPGSGGMFQATHSG